MSPLLFEASCESSLGVSGGKGPSSLRYVRASVFLVSVKVSLSFSICSVSFFSHVCSLQCWKHTVKVCNIVYYYAKLNVRSSFAGKPVLRSEKVDCKSDWFLVQNPNPSEFRTQLDPKCALQCGKKEDRQEFLQKEYASYEGDRISWWPYKDRKKFMIFLCKAFHALNSDMTMYLL